MARLNIERQIKQEPRRIEFAIKSINDLGYEIIESTDKHLKFLFNGSTVIFYPYSGWFTGKTIKDGRGINNLLKQIR